MFKLLFIFLLGFVFTFNVSAESDIKISVEKSNSITEDLGAYNDSYGWILPESYVFVHNDGYLFVDFVFSKTNEPFGSRTDVVGYRASSVLNVYSVDFDGKLIAQETYTSSEKDYKIFVKNGNIYLVSANGYKDVTVDSLNQYLEVTSSKVFNTRYSFYFTVGSASEEILDLYVTDDAYYLYSNNDYRYPYLKLDFSTMNVLNVESTDEVYSDCVSNMTNLYGNRDKYAINYNSDKDVTLIISGNNLKGFSGDYSEIDEEYSSDELKKVSIFDIKIDKYVSFSDLTFYSDYFVIVGNKDGYSVSSNINGEEVAGFKSDILFFDYEGKLLYTFENDSAVLNYVFDEKNIVLTSMSIEGICNLNTDIGIRANIYETTYMLDSYNGCKSSFTLDTYSVNIQKVDNVEEIEKEDNPDTNDIIIFSFIVLLCTTIFMLFSKVKKEC